MNDRKTEKKSVTRPGAAASGRMQASGFGGQKTLQNLLKQRDRSKNQPDGERQISRLSRQELLEILVNQSREIDRLKEELKDAQERLADREVRIAEAGTLAEASLQIYHIFEDTQKAADLYLENVRRMAGAGDDDSGEGNEKLPDEKDALEGEEDHGRDE